MLVCSLWRYATGGQFSLSVTFGGLELMMSRWMIEKRAVKRLVLLSQRTLNQLEQSGNLQYKEWLRLKRVANEHNAHVNVTQVDFNKLRTNTRTDRKNCVKHRMPFGASSSVLSLQKITLCLS